MKKTRQAEGVFDIIRADGKEERNADHRAGVKMKRLSVILFAVVLSSATFGEIRYCEKGTKNEHSHFSSHDVPLAKGVRVKQKGPVGYSCKTNDHPLVVWSRSFDGWRADFAIDVRPIDRKKSDLYVKWIKAEQIKGESAQMSVGGDWKEEAHCVMALGNAMVVAADLTSENRRAWRHLSAIPAEGGMVVLVDFCVQAGSVAAAKKHATEGCSEIARALSNFELLNPLVKKVNKSTATAWFVTPTHLVTCAHCAKEGEKFWFMDAKERRVDLKLVGRDAKSDVALLEVVDPKWRSPVSLSVARGIPRLAEEVWVLGYPIPKTLGRSIKYGEGVVSAHEGMQGDAKEFSVTAPIRPGSSGGPVFDASGRVCGIMSSTLKAQLILKLHGHVAPESNFAVKVQYVRDLLKKHGVSCEEAEAHPLPKGRADAVETATKAVVLFNSASSK